MKKYVKNMMINKWTLIITLAVFLPIAINMGLVFTDYIVEKTGNTLTAVGLNNQNWFTFWKDYISTIIAFGGVYFVWSSGNADRKSRMRKEQVDRLYDKLKDEAKVMEEITESFNTGIAYKALSVLDNIQNDKAKTILLDARDKIDQAQIKFEIMTELSDNFEQYPKGEFSESNDCELMTDLRKLFYKMENQYVELINCTMDIINRQNMTKKKMEYKKNCEKLVAELSRRIESTNGVSELDVRNILIEIDNLQREIAQIEGEKTTDAEEIQFYDKIKEIVDDIALNLRPKFIRYTKTYIDMKRKHIEEYAIEGKITYTKFISPGEIKKV